MTVTDGYLWCAAQGKDICNLHTQRDKLIMFKRIYPLLLKANARLAVVSLQPVRPDILCTLRQRADAHHIATLRIATDRQSSETQALTAARAVRVTVSMSICTADQKVALHCQ